MTLPVILALDLASLSGWACGVPGSEPVHGSVRFASLGSSHEAIFAAAYKWMNEKCVFHQPRLVVFEAPLPTSFKGGGTNVNTSTVLFGLPAVIGAAAYARGIYDIRKAETRLVRLHFIGKNMKRAQAKRETMRQCKYLGWEVADDNEADALAIWHYMCSLLEPKLAMRSTPMFARQ